MKLIFFQNPLVLFLGDVVIYFFALFAAIFLRSGEIFSYQFFDNLLFHFSILLCVWAFLFYAFRLYERGVFRAQADFLSHSFLACSIGLFLSVLYFYFLSSALVSPKVILVYFMFVFIVVWHGWRLGYGRMLKKGVLYEKFAIAGIDDSTNRFIEDIQCVGSGASSIVCVLSNNQRDSKLYFGMPLISEIEELGRMAKEKNITTVVISKEMFSRSDFVASIIPLFFTETRFLEVNSAYEEFFGKIVVDIVSPEWFLRNIARAQHIGYEMSKRALDIVIGVAGMLLCAFVLPAVYAAIKIEDRGPIFYRQTRVGKNGKEFVLFKFRTMHHQRQEQGTLWTQENDSRFTRVGRVLRRIHLDEFPQAWNIIRGDMSFVGPRAERKELAELFEKEIPFYRMRHVVKPGVTGWAQLNFPPSASIDEAKEKLGYDLFYVKNKSFFFDLAIVFKTLTLVFFSIKRKK